MQTIQIASKYAPIFEPHRFKILRGGRAAGRSHTAMRAVLLRMRERPTRVLLTREIQKSIKASVKQLLDDLIVDFGWTDTFRSTQTEITADNGSKAIFAGLRTNPESIKSMEGIDIAVIEEAQTVSRPSLDLLVPTVRKPGSEIWALYNPRYDTDPIEVMAQDPPSDTVVITTTWRDNPWFPEVLHQEREWLKSRDYARYLHVWEGHTLKRLDDKVFPPNTWRVDDLDDQVPEGTQARFGADWGFSIDPTVLVKVYRMGRTLYIAREAYQIGCPLDDLPRLFDQIPGVRQSNIVADSARPETIDLMRKRGFAMKSAIKGSRSVEEGLEFLRSHDIVVHPSCQRTIDELTTYAYKKDPVTDEVLPVLEDRNNHVIDALRYALEGERRKAPVSTFAAPEVFDR